MTTTPSSAERDHMFRIRWTIPMDVVVTVNVEPDELDAEDDLTVEEYAYDLAVERAKERLNEVSSTLNGVAVHGDIDGCEADEVEVVLPPGQASGGDPS